MSSPLGDDVLLDDLPIVLDRNGPEPLAVQVAEALRAAAASGALRVGDRLTSTRSMAARLGVSRTVTAAAYDQLFAEGWLAARRGSGTFVVAAPSGPRVTPRRPGSGSAAGGSPAGDVVDMAPGRACLEVLDRAAWRRAWRAAADSPPSAVPCYEGLQTFRAAVVEHLLRHRGLALGPERVLATAGSTAAVAEIARVLPRGSVVALEEPGYQRAAGALAAGGLQVVAAAVDDEGLRVDRLPPGLAAVYCTPAHQFPLGARLSARRRVELVQRARDEGFLVFEDDYDGELRYDVAPLPLLAALGPDVVAHLGTASKLLTPTLGVGWLVAPPRLLAAVLAARESTGSRPAPAGQQVFTELATHGDLARHLRRLRRELTARRQIVVDGLGRHAIPVRGDAAGAHVLLEVGALAEETALVAAAAAEGIQLAGLQGCHRGRSAMFGVSLGYAAPSRAALAPAVDMVGRLVRDIHAQQPPPAGGPAGAAPAAITYQVSGGRPLVPEWPATKVP
jgi:GntR family transcriptional regulator/MocR family aminotransferase